MSSKLFKIFLAALAVIIAIIGVKSGYQVGRQANYPVAYSEFITKYAAKNKLDPCLVMAVI